MNQTLKQIFDKELRKDDPAIYLITGIKIRVLSEFDSDHIYATWKSGLVPTKFRKAHVAKRKLPLIWRWILATPDRFNKSWFAIKFFTNGYKYQERFSPGQPKQEKESRGVKPF